ncbi:aldo/keto reductase [Pseudogracilibacillus sp. SE30717A]|uniref:aldo/keto reductase n=1 Tax=Pseudogracilibacillus sp. SE30717A TaxID=3098293 RepID=UPI00300E5954
MTKKVMIRGTDLEVNPIGLGTNSVGGQKYYPNITDDDGRAFLKTAIEHGVDFWDTAFTYGPKRSEEIIGEVLEETKERKNIVLASKAAHKFIGEKTVFDNSPAFLKQAVEDSLKRLRTDYIDLFYIHFPDEDTPKYEAVGALKELKDEGKIRAIGVSNFSLEQLKEANRDGYVNVYQGLYNLIERENENEIFPYTLENNISFVPYFPFASGLLAGKYTKDTKFAKGDFRKNMEQFQGETFKNHLANIEKIRAIAEAKDAEVAHVVLAWYLTRDAIDVVIPGAKREDQVHSNLKTLDVELSEQEIKEIDEIFS